MQKQTFSDGGYVIHKIPSIGICKHSAWFDAAGNLVDASRIDSAGRSFPATTRAKAYLQRVYGKSA